MKIQILMSVLLVLFAASAVAHDDNNDVHGAWGYAQAKIVQGIPSADDFPFGGYRDVTSLGNHRYRIQSYFMMPGPLRVNFTATMVDKHNHWQMTSFKPSYSIR